MIDEFIDVRATPGKRKSFFEYYDMEDKEGNMIEYWSQWRDGSVVLENVPTSELVLLRMGETEDLPLEDLRTCDCGYESELEYASDLCDWGWNTYETISFDMEEQDNTFHNSEELIEEFFDFFTYLEECLGFKVVQYTVLIEGEVIYEKC